MRDQGLRECPKHRPCDTQGLTLSTTASRQNRCIASRFADGDQSNERDQTNTRRTGCHHERVADDRQPGEGESP